MRKVLSGTIFLAVVRDATKGEDSSRRRIVLLTLGRYQPYSPRTLAQVLGNLMKA